MNQEFPRSIWVSYASAQQELVDGLGQYIEAEPNNGSLQFKIQVYLKKVATDEQGYASEDVLAKYLDTGEPIQNVVEQIATSLRRVLIFSDTYLKSEYCIWELCCCFIYSSNNMFVVFDGIGSFDDFKVSGKFEYCLGADTLVDALCKVYESRKKNMFDSFCCEEGIEPAVFFEKQLDNLSQRLHQQSQSATTAVIGGEVLQWARNFDASGAAVKTYWTFIKIHFEQWVNQNSTKILLSAMDEDKRIDFASLEQNNEDKTAGFVADFIECYHQHGGPSLCSALYQFASMLALLRLNPLWLAEMRDANPGTKLLRMAVPSYYSDANRPIYEACTAASAIQQVPVELTPSDTHIPNIDKALHVAPPPEAMTDSNQKAQRLMTMKLELVSRVMDKQGDELTSFMKRSDWKRAFGARIANRHRDKGGLLKVLRFFIDQKQFTTHTNTQAVEIIRELMQEINDGASPEREVKIGILQLLDKSDGDIVYLDNADLLQDLIEQLLECR
jgi:hypothetical protein